MAKGNLEYIKASNWIDTQWILVQCMIFVHIIIGFELSSLPKLQ